MLTYCFHTHTKRCGHATGEDEQYVLEAIKYGIKELGFTDHVFLPYKSQPGIRGDYSLLDDYLSSLKSLKEKYKDQIRIYIGFECEYYEEYENYYRHLLDDKIVDYLILGQHCYIDENGKFQWYLHQYTPKEDYVRYKDDLIKGIRSGLFTYVAHPDLFFSSVSDNNEFIVNISKEICKEAEKAKIPLEINLGGLKYHKNYPNDLFFSIARQYNIDFVIGVDAHYPEEFERIKNPDYEEFIARNHLNVLWDYRIKKD